MPDDYDDRPRSSRGAKRRYRERDDRDEADDRPRTRRRVKGNGSPPVALLLGLVGGAVVLLLLGGGGLWWWVASHPGGGKVSGPGGDYEFEVTVATRSENGGRWKGAKPFAVGWLVEPRATDGTDNYFVVVRYAGQMREERITGVGKFDGHSGTTEFDTKGEGPAEVWVEKRQNPATPGKVVSNVRVAR